MTHKPSLFLAFASALLVSCSDPSSPPRYLLTVISGSGQLAQVGTALPAALVVRVTDENGAAVSGIPVQWASTTAGGVLTPASAMSDSDGRVNAVWTLGQSPGEQNASASVDGFGSVVFTATAYYGASGRVVDRDDYGISSVTVNMGQFGSVLTDISGYWSKDTLTAPITITAGKTQWIFAPDRVDITGPMSEIAFQGSVAAEPGTLKLSLRWDALAAIAPSPHQLVFSPDAGTGMKTHVGIRLLGPGDAASSGAVPRMDAESHAVITVPIPAAGLAELHVATVRHEPGGAAPWQRNRVFFLGIVDGLPLLPGQSYVLDMQDVTWTHAEWIVPDGEVGAMLLAGRLHGDKHSTDLWFDIHVRDPFQNGINPPYEDLVFGLNGFASGWTTLSNGWRRYIIVCNNSSVGIEHVSQCHFYPFLRAGLFGLPDARYAPSPMLDPFEVEWR